MGVPGRQALSGAAEPGASDGERSLVDYGMIIWRRRWLVLTVGVAAMLATVAATWRAPRTYEALGRLMIVTGPIRLDEAIAAVRQPGIAEEAIRKLSITARLGTGQSASAAELLQNGVRISRTIGEIATVRSQAPDSALAADIAAFYVEKLEELLVGLGDEQLERPRRDNLRRLERTEHALAAIEAELARLKTSGASRADIQRQEYRRLALQGVVLGVITQLEQASMDQPPAKTTVQVLRRPTPPDRPLAPNLVLNFIVATVVGLAGGALLALVVDGVGRGSPSAR